MAKSKLLKDLDRLTQHAARMAKRRYPQRIVPRLVAAENGRARMLLKSPQPKLDIGCGAGHDPSWIGIDIQALPGVDIVHDIETYPWPLPDGRVALAMASHVAEHISPAKFGFIKWMNEVWRVLRPEGQFMMALPYACGAGFVQDPTHVNPCNENTWRYFDPLDPSGFYKFYRPRPWKIVSCSFSVDGFMEVVLEKRREDQSYAQ